MRRLWVLGLLVALARTANAEDRPEDVAEAHPRFLGGVQAGGANVALVDFRIHTIGGVYLELGAQAGVLLLMTGSAGLLVDRPINDRWSIYLAGGASGLTDIPDIACSDADGPDCTDRVAAVFLYARVGLARRRLLASTRYKGARCEVDIGFWRGEVREYGGNSLRERSRFMIPMLGVTYLRW